MKCKNSDIALNKELDLPNAPSSGQELSAVALRRNNSRDIEDDDDELGNVFLKNKRQNEDL